LVIDEIDNFSKSSDQNSKFKKFLSIFMSSSICPKIVGISNSVELFKGELTNKDDLSKSYFESQNRLQIMFNPYSQEDLSKILFHLLKNHFEKEIPIANRIYFEKLFDSFCLTPTFKNKSKVYKI
jgi:Cdc6-like AAA superfamily ATPase